MNTVVYIHGKGGSAEESRHYLTLFPDCEVVGLDYRTSTPWETGREIHDSLKERKAGSDGILLIANSIGAFFSMHADIGLFVRQAFFISPVVDMEKMITGMMAWAGVTEAELESKGVIPTAFGEDLSWEYLCYVRNHPAEWEVPTQILYGSRDTLVPYETVRDFAEKHSAGITVMDGGEHWFHTEEQMRFLDAWIRREKEKIRP